MILLKVLRMDIAAKLVSLYSKFLFPVVFYTSKHGDFLKVARDGDAGYDVKCVGGFSILPGQRMVISTGCKFILPRGYKIKLESKSGLSLKYGIEVGAGLVDSAFKKEVQVILYNHGDKIVSFIPGDKIAQACFERVVRPLLIYINEEKFNSLPSEFNNDRDGFGSTGR